MLTIFWRHLLLDNRPDVILQHTDLNCKEPRKIFKIRGFIDIHLLTCSGKLLKPRFLILSAVSPWFLLSSCFVPQPTGQRLTTPMPFSSYNQSYRACKTNKQMLFPYWLMCADVFSPQNYSHGQRKLHEATQQQFYKLWLVLDVRLKCPSSKSAVGRWSAIDRERRQHFKSVHHQLFYSKVKTAFSLMHSLGSLECRKMSKFVCAPFE